MTDRRDLGTAVRLLREQKGLSVLALSVRAHLDRKVILHVERGGFGVSMETINSIATALGIESWQLLRFAGQVGANVSTLTQEAA